VWQLRGKYPNRGYPNIFKDANVGKQAQEVFDDAQKMLTQLLAENWLEGRVVYSYFPCNSDDNDDILVFEPTDDADEARRSEQVIAKLHGLRQQAQKEDMDMPYLCLSDFVAPVQSKGKNTIVFLSYYLCSSKLTNKLTARGFVRIP
jgi:5-methyltetrahydrofolate--homocysteine methyltransferase